MAFTYFFRDSQAMELAIEDTLPNLQGRAFIHIWDAGCAHGPEPYTLAILLRERMSQYVFRNVRIHATDVDGNFGPQIRSGVFTEQEVRRIPRAVFQKYFRPAATSGFVEIDPELRSKITFLHHDLLSLRPVREGISLIVCKNVLLHFDEGQRIQVLRMFHEALQPDGMLVMEQTQKLPQSLGPCFSQVVPHAQVYRKTDRAFAEHPGDQRVLHRHGKPHADETREAPAPRSRLERIARTSAESLSHIHNEE